LVFYLSPFMGWKIHPLGPPPLRKERNVFSK
jgi:hypothetical protein